MGVERSPHAFGRVKARGVYFEDPRGIPR